MSADEQQRAAGRAAGDPAPAARPHGRGAPSAQEEDAKQTPAPGGGARPGWRSVLEILRLDDAEVLRRIARGGSRSRTGPGASHSGPGASVGDPAR